MDALIRAGLGPLAADEIAVTTVFVILNPSVSGGFRWRGMSTEAAADLLTDLLVPWLERRTSVQQPSGKQKGRPLP
jgi:hypothetical protein